jgi:transcriptional regulator of acetoin/glycerol metabolism
MIPETDMQRLRSLSRAVRGGTLDPQRLAERAYQMGCSACHSAVSTPEAPTDTLNLTELEKIAMAKAIKQTGNLVAASQLLGISKTSIYRKAKEYGIDLPGLVCPNCRRRLTQPAFN